MHNTPPFARQRVLIVASVLLLHALALWALQSGLLLRLAVLAEEVVVPVAVITKPPPVVTPAPVAPRALQPVAPKPKPEPSRATPKSEAGQASVADKTQQIAPAPIAVAEVPTASSAPADSQQAVVAAATLASRPSPPSPSPSPSPQAESQSIEADYFVKPSLTLSSFCTRRGAQGKVVVRVLVGVDGVAVRGEIATSSGFPCFDREALSAALTAKYKPAVRAGVTVEVWRLAPYTL